MEQRRDDALDRLPAYQEDGVTVYLGDAREVMTNLPAESVDCVVTSPPYWGLRDFGVPPTAWGGDPACRTHPARCGLCADRKGRPTCSTAGQTAFR